MKRKWTSEELLEHFTLLPDEFNAVGNKSGATRLGFAVLLKCFQPTGSREAIDPEFLQKRLLLCMYGMGTNMGLKRMAGIDPNITAEDLRYTRWRYLHKEHMRAAIAQVVNALFRARLESIWGVATSTCASDSKRFYAADQNLLTQWHARYRAPGVLVYWHVERRSVCIYSQLKSCTSSEVAVMLEGVLRHCTDMTIGLHGLHLAVTHQGLE